MKRITQKAITSCCILIILGILYSCFINDYILRITKDQIIPVQNSIYLENIDCIMVLGAGVENNKPSLMLEDRLKKSIELYNLNVSPKLLMTGDHGHEGYDEVNVMKNYAKETGIPSQNIFMDHAGFSTYDSIYRAKAIFKVKKMVIVSQAYHLPRALYIANELDIEAYGVAAEDIKYSGQSMREYREFLARNKDFLKTILKPYPTYLGKEIPVFGNGDLTND